VSYSITALATRGIAFGIANSLVAGCLAYNFEKVRRKTPFILKVDVLILQRTLFTQIMKVSHKSYVAQYSQVLFWQVRILWVNSEQL
jgi:hypothetical protein